MLALGENADAPSGLETISIFDILFNKVELLSIDFFDISDTTSLVGKFRVNIAAWFYIMRNVAGGILLVILIYVGIKMALSTVASDRAMYKRMFADWVVSLLLIFILNYIIVFTIGINNALVGAFESVLEANDKLAATMETFAKHGLNPFGGITSIVAAIIYIMLIWQTMALFFSYFNRMLKIGFLIIISPLISITYSIDKMGDGKAQALNSWLKEFVYTILMQPFHCAIYMSLISTAINLFTGLNLFGNKVSETLGAGIMALVCIMFTKEAEKIVRKIFAFQDDNKDTSLVAGVAVASMAMNKAKSFGTNGAKFINNGKNFFKNGREAFRLANIKAEGVAAFKYLKGGKDNGDVDGNQKDYATIRSEERAKSYAAQAQKWEKELDEAQQHKEASEKIRTRALEAEKERLSLAGGREMSPEELEAVARFNVAKSQIEEEAFKNLGDGRHMFKNAYRAGKRTVKGAANAPGKVYKNVKNGLGKVSDALPYAETRKLIAEEAKKSAGFFTGAATLGLSGKVSGAVAAAVATNKAVETYSKSSKGTFANDVNKFAGKHSVAKLSDKKKQKVLQDIAKNGKDYDLDSGVSDKLRDIIEELKSDPNSRGNLDEEDIKNTIIANKKTPDKVLNILFPNRNEKEPSAAQNKLQNYACEYAISNKFASANEVGVSSASVIKEACSEPTLTKEEQITSIEIGMKFLEGAEDTQESINRVAKSENPKMLASVSEELDTAIEEKREQLLSKMINDTTITSGNEFAIRQYENAIEALEMKKALLLANAVLEIEDKNKELKDKLEKEFSEEISRLVGKDYEEDELKELQRQLEEVKGRFN